MTLDIKTNSNFLVNVSGREPEIYFNTQTNLLTVFFEFFLQYNM